MSGLPTTRPLPLKSDRRVRRVITLSSSVTESVQQFKASPWAFEKTLVTPRADIRGFLSALVEVFPIAQGEASTDEVVFEPRNVLELMADRELSLHEHWSFCASVSGAEDVQELLAAMLSDWIDFAFVPSPATFALYADHDDHLTIYVPTQSGLDRVVACLEAKGFSFVEDYARPPGYLKRDFAAGPHSATE